MSGSSYTPEAAKVAVVRAWVGRQPEGVRQFLKFAVVGGSSTALDLLTWNLLFYVLPVVPYAMAHAAIWLTGFVPALELDSTKTAAAMASVVSSGVVGTGNAFYWNRRWTFRAVGHDLATTQIRRFLVVAYAGMALRALIVYLLVPEGAKDLPPMEALLYNGVAIGIVMFWNFFLNRFWTFRRRGEASSE